jgi:hypothetical protein
MREPMLNFTNTSVLASPTVENGPLHKTDHTEARRVARRSSRSAVPRAVVELPVVVVPRLSSVEVHVGTQSSLRHRDHAHCDLEHSAVIINHVRRQRSRGVLAG